MGFLTKQSFLGLLGFASFLNPSPAASKIQHDLSRSLIFDQDSEFEIIDSRIAITTPFDISSLPRVVEKKTDVAIKNPTVVVETVAQKSKASEMPKVAPQVTPLEPKVFVANPTVALTHSQPEHQSRNEGIVSTQLPAPIKMKIALRPKFERGNLFIFKEDSLTQEGFSLGVPGAEVIWFGAGSDVITRSNETGFAPFAEGKIYSAKFVVKAPGFLPAIGYARNGKVTPVALFSEARLAPVLKSLKTTPQSGKTLVFGKILDPKGLPASDIQIETSSANKNIFYSFGEWSLFMPNLTQTGASGDFLISDMNSSFELILPTSKSPAAIEKELAAAAIDFTQIGPVASVTLIEGSRFEHITEIRDGGTLEFPEGLMAAATSSGQSDYYKTDLDGFLKLNNIRDKPTSELLEVRFPGYKDSWLSPIASEPKSTPTVLPLYTQFDLENMFDSVREFTSLELGLVLGNLTDTFFTDSYQIEVLNSLGIKQDLFKVFYFNQDNSIQARLNQTHPSKQNFAIPNLAPGEWQIRVVNAKTQEVIAVQVVRTNLNTISYVQF